MKRRLSPRCAPATEIVRPWESTVETQPQLQPALLSLSAIISQYFMRGGFCLFCSLRGNDKIVMNGRDDSRKNAPGLNVTRPVSSQRMVFRKRNSILDSEASPPALILALGSHDYHHLPSLRS